MTWLAKLLFGGMMETFTASLLSAWKAKLDAETDEKRLAAEQAIKGIEAARDIAVAEAADRWSDPGRTLADRGSLRHLVGVNLSRPDRQSVVRASSHCNRCSPGHS